LKPTLELGYTDYTFSALDRLDNKIICAMVMILLSLVCFWIVRSLLVYFLNINNIPDSDHLYEHTPARTFIICIDAFIINMLDGISFYSVNVGNKIYSVVLFIAVLNSRNDPAAWPGRSSFSVCKELKIILYWTNTNLVQL